MTDPVKDENSSTVTSFKVSDYLLVTGGCGHVLSFSLSNRSISGSLSVSISTSMSDSSPESTPKSPFSPKKALRS